MKRILKLLLIYIFIFILFTIIYLFLFHSPLYKTQTVLFYRGLVLLLLSVFLTILILFICFKQLNSCFESIIAALITAIAIHLSFFIVFPVTFERSVTMYLLTTLKNNSSSTMCRGLNRSSLTDRLINEYIIKNNAVAKRIREQELIKLIENQKDCVGLTERGLKFINFAELIKKMYGLK